LTQQVYTSDLLARLIKEAPKDTVDLDWLLGHLRKRAFGLLLLILAIAMVVPGLGIISTIAVSFPAVEMMLGRERPTLPRFLTKRAIATERFTGWAERSLPLLRLVERVSRSRSHARVGAAKRAVGLLVLLLALSGVGPLPLINLLPAATIALLAVSYLQEDDLLLGVAFAIGIVSLLIFGVLLWTSAAAIKAFFGTWLQIQ
jgi:hypothetical protein